MTTITTAPAFTSAACLRFVTFAATPLARLALERWQTAAPPGERRQVDEVHDVLSALAQIDVERPVGVTELRAAAYRLRNPDYLPAQDLLGTTTFVVAKTTRPGAGPALLTGILDGKSGPIDGGAWGQVGTVHAALDPDVIAIVCPPGDAADRRLGAALYGPVRLAEIMHHKIEGQYREYQEHLRPALLAAAEELDQALRPLADQMSAATEPALAPTLDRGRAVMGAYCRAVQALAPVQRVRSMLDGNLHNLAALAGDAFWQRRAQRDSQCLAQVDADLGLVRPVFDAAQWVGQFHHSRLLAQMNLTEMAESRQRDRDDEKRETHNRRLMVLGVWLGLAQIWAAYLSMLPTEHRPTGPGLAWLSFAPALIGLVLLGGTLILEEIRRKSTP
jgi:hypothetical protein